MNNLKLYENNILVKADTKTQDYLNEWVEASRERWLEKQKKTGQTVDENLLVEQQKKGVIMAHEKALIPHFEEIKLEFKEALEDHQAGQIPSTMAESLNEAEETAAAD